MTFKYADAVPPNRLPELRARSRLTQAELATLLGCDPTLISQYESLRRRITEKNVKALASVFKVESYELFSSPEDTVDK